MGDIQVLRAHHISKGMMAGFGGLHCKLNIILKLWQRYNINNNETDKLEFQYFNV